MRDWRLFDMEQSMILHRLTMSPGHLYEVSQIEAVSHSQFHDGGWYGICINIIM